MSSAEQRYREALEKIYAEAATTRHSWEDVAQARQRIKEIAGAALRRKS